MRVFIASFTRCLSSPWRAISHGMSSGCTIFLRLALRAGSSVASSSSAWYSFWLALPFIHAFDSLQAMFGSSRRPARLRALRYGGSAVALAEAERSASTSIRRLFVVIEVLFEVARLESFRPRRGRRRPRLHDLLEEHVHEHEHRLGLHDERARRPGRAGVEMLVDAVVVDDGDVAGFPVVADAVVNLVALAVEDVERRFVDVAVLLRVAARRVLLEVDVKHLREAVLRLDVVAAVRLRAVVESDQPSFPYPRHRPQPRELLPQVVGTRDRANEDTVLLAVIVRLADDDFVGDRRAFHFLGPGSSP